MKSLYPNKIRLHPDLKCPYEKIKPHINIKEEGIKFINKIIGIKSFI